MIALLLAIAQEPIVYRAARVIPVEGADLAPGWVHLAEGRIAAVGTGEPPAGVEVRDLGDAVLMPGCIDANPPFGFGPVTNEESDEVTPTVRAADLIDPASTSFLRARSLGITSLFVGPGTANVIGGLGAVAKTRGGTLEAIVVKADVALVAAMGDDPSGPNSPPWWGVPGLFTRRPTTRMGVEWEFRRAFHRARQYRDARTVPPLPDQEILVSALEGRLPIRITARRATDIETALRLAREFGLTIQLVEAQEAHRILDLVARDKPPVLLAPHLTEEEAYGPEGCEPSLASAARLTAAGMAVAISATGEEESQGPLAAAAWAVRFGMAPGQALRAVTIVPAELLGVADRVGSLAPGKDADVLVLSGDPLAATTRVVAVLIEGQVAFGEMPN